MTLLSVLRRRIARLSVAEIDHPVPSSLLHPAQSMIQHVEIIPAFPRDLVFDLPESFKNRILHDNRILHIFRHNFTAILCCFHVYKSGEVVICAVGGLARLGNPSQAML